MNKDINLRTSFNSEARLYHGIRPRYSETLFETLVKVTNLQENAHLLEIGPGTGQATEALARRGYKITAVELGPDLAQIAREVLNKYKGVEVITRAFEDIEFPPESFDLVYAATAYHWIRPEIRFIKPSNLLKQNGHLAIIHTNHVSDEAGDKFFFASQPIYKKYNLYDQDDSFRLPFTSDLMPEKLDEKLFAPVLFKAFPMIVRYTAKEYAQLLATYSPILSMKPEMRVLFLKDISDLLKEKFDGSLIKQFAMTLTIGKKSTDIV